ncbi:uncharacterized protein LODBEIA_P53320 [Lodderomyces beijingensis]|uniref:Autophagy-related protein 9 n=1 Tax=Lodderomyces beijingensis TaxID=1775926 RepID=A0ABP0ZSJ6_9ASCO
MEIFQRGQARDYLETLSPEEREQTLESVHRLVQQDQQQRASSKYYEIRWHRRFIPLVHLQYSRIWQTVTLSNFVRVVRAAAQRALKFLVKAVRITLFIVAAQSYFRGMVSVIFSFCDVMTFNDNFLRDLLTYAFQDAPSILRHREALAAHKGDIFYFYNLEEYQHLSTLQSIIFAVKNHFASMLVATCTKTDNGDAITCRPYTNTLIFKVQDVVGNCYPRLSKGLVMMVTVSLYLIYATIGNLVCMNIFIFYTSNLLLKWMRVASVAKNLFYVVWTSFFDLIA